MAKRKEIEEDAMEGGLSHPASKIRRLDPELPYLIEEVPYSDGGEAAASEMAYTVEDPVVYPPPAVLSDDRAIVLYRPSDDASLDPGPVPANPSLLISPAMLRNLKNLHQGSNQNLEDTYPAGNDCLAMVPWVPPVPGASTATYYWSNHLQTHQNPVVIEELMESEESTAMEVEDEPAEAEPPRTVFEGSGGGGGCEGFQQQWQLHCMVPGNQPNATSHLMWSR